MHKKEKYKVVQKTITIKRAIQVDNKLREYIFRNSNYRRHVWNDFVEEYRRCKETGEIFNVNKYAKIYRSKHGSEGNSGYCVGILDQVSSELKMAFKICKVHHGQLHFHSFNPYKSSFKVHCSPEFQRKNTNTLSTKFRIDSEKYGTFRSSKGIKIKVNFKESLYKKEDLSIDPADNRVKFFYSIGNYVFRNEDVKTISFLYELGKFYVLLTVTGWYINEVKEKDPRKKGGIDLGIHNPYCIYDGYSKPYIGKMSDKQLNRIHYLERRVKRLQSIMDKKKRGSKNYEKVRKKFRITHKKIHDIRLDWRRKEAKRICKFFKKIAVDSYKIPKREDHNEFLPKNVIKSINAFNRMHAAYLFNEVLIHDCVKYNTRYIKAKENTTRTCSVCGHINPHLPLGKRMFVCEECGHKEDRDSNAAKNCYDFEWSV